MEGATKSNKCWVFYLLRVMELFKSLHLKIIINFEISYLSNFSLELMMEGKKILPRKCRKCIFLFIEGAIVMVSYLYKTLGNEKKVWQHINVGMTI